jgi:radical SAM superfamily enzyme YgiQ (UPF0313 family)
MTMDLLLINPCSRPRVYQSLGAELAAVEPPVWAGLMATYARRRGLSVAVIDAEAEGLSAAEVSGRVREASPTLAAIVAYGHQPSASTQVMTAAGECASAIKSAHPTQAVMMLGGHVAALPQRTLREEACDLVATGEGLGALVDAVEALKSAHRDWSKVPGVCYREGGEVRRTPARPLVRDLDGEMPGVAWDLLPMHRYRAHNWHCLDGRERQPYAAIYTTLGCPYHCSFCCIQAPFKEGEAAAGLRDGANSYRYWPVERVVAEIDTLVQRYGVRNIKIADEMFVLSRKHVVGICEKLIERRYDLNIWAYTRIDTIKEGMLPALRDAGFTWLAVGIEAGAGRVRDGVDKSFGQDEIHRMIEAIRAEGINVIANYIFGLPEDDLDTMQATLDLAIELNCEFSNFYSAMAYPGSPLYAEASARGVPLPAAWTGYSQHSRDCLPLPTRHVPAREVLSFRDEAFQRYYTHPRYLAMLESRFGPPAADAVRRMTAHRLERDLLTGALSVPDVLLPAAPRVPSLSLETR